MDQRRLDLIQEMLEKNPGDSFLNYAAALEYHKEGQPKKAIEVIESLLQRDENYLGAYYKLGKLYEEMGEVDKAITTYRKGKEIAKKTNDAKTTGELVEALMILDEDEGDW